MSELAVYTRSEAGLFAPAKARRHSSCARDDAAGPIFRDLQRLWRVLGLNQRRLSRRFYRPLPLTTRATRLGNCALSDHSGNGSESYPMP